MLFKVFALMQCRPTTLRHKPRNSLREQFDIQCHFIVYQLWVTKSPKLGAMFDEDSAEIKAAFERADRR